MFTRATYFLFLLYKAGGDVLYSNPQLLLLKTNTCYLFAKKGVGKALLKKIS